MVGGERSAEAPGMLRRVGALAGFCAFTAFCTFFLTVGTRSVVGTLVVALMILGTIAAVGVWLQRRNATAARLVRSADPGIRAAIVASAVGKRLRELSPSLLVTVHADRVELRLLRRWHSRVPAEVFMRDVVRASWLTLRTPAPYGDLLELVSADGSDVTLAVSGWQAPRADFFADALSGVLREPVLGERRAPWRERHIVVGNVVIGVGFVLGTAAAALVNGAG